MRTIALLLASLFAVTTVVQDPAPTGVRLVYEMPVEALQRSLRDRPDIDLEELLTETIGNMQARVPKGTKVTRSGGATFTIELPDGRPETVERVRANIEVVGKFEMRIVADSDYATADGFRFDLKSERKRLEAWLDDGGREKMAESRSAIAEYRAKSPHLRWFVHRIREQGDQKGRWAARMHERRQFCTVPLHSEKEWNRGKVPAGMLAQNDPPVLLELVAVNMHEQAFTGDDIDRAKVQMTEDPSGKAMVRYQMRGNVANEYADFSEKYLNKCCALLWEDEVLQAPMFMSRLPGIGAISGVEPEVARQMESALRAPLVAKPQLLRIEAR